MTKCPNCAAGVEEASAGVVRCPRCGTAVSREEETNPYAAPKAPIVPQPPPDYAEPESGMALASFILGLLGILIWCQPGVGLPVCVLGLILGWKSAGESGYFAITGMVLSSIGLLLNVLAITLILFIEVRSF